MQSDDPAYLTVGTEVSAKFKGAFCEAKVKKVSKSIKVKVQLKQPPFGTTIVEDTSLPKNAKIEVNEIVMVQQGKNLLKGIIQSVKDCSKYHVVFNDGDEKELRRTQICLKGAKHFDAAGNLDALPLYNPEQFSSPVVRNIINKNKNNLAKKRKLNENSANSTKKRKNYEEESDEDGAKLREKRAAASAASVAIGEMEHTGDTQSEESSADSSEEKDKEKERRRKREEELEKERLDSDNLKRSQGEKTRKEKEKTREKSRLLKSESLSREPIFDLENFSPGECVIVFDELTNAAKLRDAITTLAKTLEKEKEDNHSLSSNPSSSKIALPSSCVPIFYKKSWYPAIVVSNRAYQKYCGRKESNVKKDEVPIRKFSDGKYICRSKLYLVPFYFTPSFSRKKLDEMEHNQQKMAAVIEMAQRFCDEGKLPNGWTLNDINDSPDDGLKNTKNIDRKQKPSTSKNDNENESDLASSDGDSDEDAPTEEKDLFIAHLYKFHEESASPINRVPILGGKEIDLYQLYRLVQNRGGAKKVTANGKWGRILSLLKLNGCPGANSVTIKKAYMRYLEPYAVFKAKLGWSFDGRAADPVPTTARSERVLPKPGQLRELEKPKKKKKDMKTHSSSKERDSVRGSKEGSVVDCRSPASSHEGEIKGSTPELAEKKEKGKTINEERPEDTIALNNENIVVEEKVKVELPETEQASDNNEGSIPTEKPTVEKDFKREKSRTADDSNDDSEENRKKKEKKRTSMAKRSERKGLSSTCLQDDGSKQNDEGYQLSNVLSQFYMGQKVRANHNGQWYDARVVEITQPKPNEICSLLLRGENPEALTNESVEELNKLSREVKCFVHYLGWNSRYDEWITLNKLKISDKDQCHSRMMIREAGNGQEINEHRMALAETCCPGFCGDDEFSKVLESVKASLKLAKKTQTYNKRKEEKNVPSTSSSSNGIATSNSNNLKSLPITISTMISDPNLTVRDVASAAAGIEPRSRGSRLNLNESPVKTKNIIKNQIQGEDSEEKVRRESTPKREVNEENLNFTKTCSTEPSTSESSQLQSDLNNDAENTHISGKKLFDQDIKLEEEDDDEETPKTAEENYQSEVHNLNDVNENDEKKNVEQVDKQEEELNGQDIEKSSIQTTISKNSIAPIKSTENNNDTNSQIVEENVDSAKLLDESAKNNHLPFCSPLLKRTMESGPLNMSPEKLESIQKTKAEKNQDKDGLNTAKNEKPEDTSETNDDGKPLHATPELNGPAGRIGRIGNFSGGRGSSKRKRMRHSNMVIDKKYHRNSTGKKNQDVDDIDDDEEVPIRGSFHAMKMRMHKIMEMENSLHDLTLLELPDFETILKSTSEDQICDILEDRAFKLREIYSQAKTELVAMEKKKKRFYEKIKKDRIRRSATPKVCSISSSESDHTSRLAEIITKDPNFDHGSIPTRSEPVLISGSHSN